MGFGLPRVIVNEKDLSHYVDTVIKGVSCVLGVTERGPVGKPMLISSEIQFNRVFGGEIKSSDFPLICKRALSYGAVLWVSRVVHYSNAAESGTSTAVSSSVTLSDRQETSKATLKVSALTPGVWGDRLKVSVAESVLDSATLFTVKVIEGNEVVETIPDVSMDDESDYYIKKFKSSYIVVEDLESGGTGGSDRPKLGEYALSGGNDGTTGLCDADYIGDSAAKTGFYAFDDVSDAIQLACPSVSSGAVTAAGLSYCEKRGDLLFIAETPFDLEPQEAVDFRLGKGAYSHSAFSSSYGAMYYPKIKVYDVAAQRERLISPTGDVLGVMAVNDWAANESFSPAGIRRGRVLNALGVDINVGGRGRFGDGNFISENQINPVCVFEDSGTVVWGAQTLQRTPSLLREINVRRMLIVIKKSIAAYARAFIHQPNDPRTWREFYRGIEPKFREWKAQRWFYDYRIDCDQQANSLSEAKLNTPESVQRGEFKCVCFIKPVVGIKWILLDAVITRLDANFEESLTDVVGH